MMLGAIEKLKDVTSRYTTAIRSVCLCKSYFHHAVISPASALSSLEILKPVMNEVFTAYSIRAYHITLTDRSNQVRPLNLAFYILSFVQGSVQSFVRLAAMHVATSL